MQILRYLSLNEPQFLGCTSAFIETLNGSLNAAVMYLRKLERQRKGSAFAFEMQMDQARYGALIILDRWAEFVAAFAPHAEIPRYRQILDETPSRVKSAGELIERTNAFLDAGEWYTAQAVAACESGFQTVELIFSQEREAATQAQALGPMLSDDFKDYRRVFLGDLSSR